MTMTINVAVLLELPHLMMVLLLLNSYMYVLLYFSVCTITMYILYSVQFWYVRPHHPGNIYIWWATAMFTNGQVCCGRFHLCNGTFMLYSLLLWSFFIFLLQLNFPFYLKKISVTLKFCRTESCYSSITWLFMRCTTLKESQLCEKT